MEAKPKPRVACLVLNDGADYATEQLLGMLRRQSYSAEDRTTYVIDSFKLRPHGFDESFEATMLTPDQAMPTVKAFNWGMRFLEQLGCYEYYWLLRRWIVLYDEDTLELLINQMSVRPKCAAIQPAMRGRNPKLASAGVTGVSEVDYVEWQVPLLSQRALFDVGWPDDELWENEVNLDWCYRAHQLEWSTMVYHGVRVGKAGVADSSLPISLRDSEARLCKKWGDDWMYRLDPDNVKLWSYVHGGR